jgi:lipid A 4'-phosphatase
MRMVDPYLPAEMRFRRRFLMATAALAAVLGILLVSWPEIDLALSRAVQLCPGAPNNAPWCEADPTVAGLRSAFMLLTVVISAAVLFGTGRTIWQQGGLVGLAQARWCFLAAMLAIGPGLVANVILKDNWGRARPRHVVEFGGTKHFTPPLVPVSECARNCSFVSGEASSAYAPFFAAALLLPQFRVALIAGGALSGLAAGLIRMSQGGHFLSDVLFAGIFMALTASVLHILFIGLWRERSVIPYVEAFQLAWGRYVFPAPAPVRSATPAGTLPAG